MFASPTHAQTTTAAALARRAGSGRTLRKRKRSVFEALKTSGMKGNSAYFPMMTARPQTVGYGATDSPAGLAAWVLVHPGFAQRTYGADPPT